MITIYAPQYRKPGAYYELPLGLAYISAYIKSKGIETQFINENEEALLPDFGDRFVAAIQRSTVFCTGGLSVHYRQLKTVVDEVRQINKQIKIVLGGGIIGSEPELMLNDFKADHVIVGEGEVSLYNLLTGKETRKIVYADAIDNLDDLPWPDYEGLGVRHYLDRQLCGDEHYTYPVNKPRALPIISSRSCPYNCIFCYHPIGKKYRQRSIASFAAEVEYLKKTYNVNILCLLDELISDDEARLLKICEVMKRNDIRWMTQMRVTNVTKATMRAMKEAGCFQLSLGIEHINNGVLKAMHKKTTRAQIEQALKLCYETGIGIQGNVLIGSPAETPETVKELLEWWKANLKYTVNLTPIIPYPGSELYKHYVADGTINPLDYIRNGCQFISKYYHDAATIDRTEREHNSMPAEVLEHIRSSNDEHRGTLYSVTVKCPHCKFTVKYEGLYNGATGNSFIRNRGYRIACKECNQRFDIDL